MTVFVTNVINSPYKVNRVNIKLKMNNFNRYLQSSLSYKQYNDLQLLLGISPHRLTKCISNPAQLKVEEIRKLAKLCKTDPRHLILHYECGFNSITVAEAVALGLHLQSPAQHRA